MLGMNLDSLLPMVAKMAGVTPEMMRAYMQNMFNLVKGHDDRMGRIEAQNIEILRRLRVQAGEEAPADAGEVVPFPMKEVSNG